LACRSIGEQGQHTVAHQVDRLCDGRNIDAWFQTLDAAAKNGSHIRTGQNVSLNQTLKKRESSHTIGDCDALSAAAEKADHGSFSISPKRDRLSSKEIGSSANFVTPTYLIKWNSDWGARGTGNLPRQQAAGKPPEEAPQHFVTG
jgi:hypothetical protein